MEEQIPNTLILRRPGPNGKEERIGFKDLAWASPYITRSGLRGVLILLNEGEFRFYVNKFEEVQLHYELYVGRMLKAGKKVVPLWDGQ